MKQQNRNGRQKRRQDRVQQIRQERKSAQRFREPLTSKRARKVAGSYAKSEFKPLERQISSEIRGSAKREGEISQWYGQLAADVGTSTAQAADAFKAAEAATTQRLADAASRNDESLKALSTEDAKFAELVNAPTNAPGLSQAAEAGAANDRLRVILNQPNTDRGANAIAAAGPKLASTRLAGIKAHGDERTRRTSMNQDLRSTKRERGASIPKYLQQLREGDRQFALEQRAFTDEKPYEEALREQSKLGLKGKKVSANAQVTAAALYSKAKESGAGIQKEVARLNKEGKYRTAKALENQAKTYGKNSDKGGYNTREASGLLASAGKDFGSVQAMVNYLVNRGVKLPVARQAVNKALKK